MLDLSLLTVRNLLLWMVGWSLVGFVLMGEDKDQAVMQEHLENKDRISERTLQEVALVGGFPGIVIGAMVFHHKTSKPPFWGPVVIAAASWTILFAVALRYFIHIF